MSVFREFLSDLGINATNILAGFSGGLLNVFWFKKTEPFEAIGAILAGALTANYLGAPFAEYTHFPTGATSFIVGFAGLQVVGSMLAMLKRRGLAENGGK